MNDNQLFNLKLEVFEGRMKEESEKTKGLNVIINQYFTRRDGFSTSRKIKVNRLTKGDYYYWIRRPYRLPIKMPLTVCDEKLPCYFTDNIVEFNPVGNNFKKNLKNCILDIYYEEI